MHPFKITIGQIFIFFYSILAYLIGLGGLIYFVLFIGGWDFLPFHIESGVADNANQAFLINGGLVLLFGLQHSVMARPAFKKRFTKLIPQAAERSTYVLLSGVMMLVISYFWQPMNGVLWEVFNPIARFLLTAGYLFGWAFAVVATFVINHFELFGLQQAYNNLVGKPEATPKFTARFLYSMVRHPLQLGVLIGLWSTPTMSLTHLFLSITFTIYIFIGLYFEERDLVATLGSEYEAYQQRVPKIIPVPTAVSHHKPLAEDWQS